ncbi:hypothetical protein [Cryobacterium sp. BB736]|uniref:hypothetical protein n=1 Tax=Cryobacterium sp. BB736 TaxID=2746963 RepID=UPI001D0BF11A|nr:hypothetical protein [Cryobacterium sp. BB736]
MSAPRAGEANPPLPQRAQDDRRNFPATIGFILGVLSVVLPVFVLSVAAFIVGGIGAARARGWGRLGYRPNGRRRAGWGVFLGILGVLLSIVVGYVVLWQWAGVDLGLKVGAYLDPALAWLREAGVPIP